MNSQMLCETVKLLFADNKGLLAMDESTGICNRRFEKQGIPQTVEARRAYRELIVTPPGLGESIGGAILFDETIHHLYRIFAAGFYATAMNRIRAGLSGRNG